MLPFAKVTGVEDRAGVFNVHGNVLFCWVCWRFLQRRLEMTENRFAAEFSTVLRFATQGDAEGLRLAMMQLHQLLLEMNREIENLKRAQQEI